MNIKQIREKRGISQKQIAEAMGVDTPLISKIESYKCLPTPPGMDVIARLLQCDIDEMYEPHEITYSNAKRRRKDGEEYKVCVRFEKDIKHKLKELFRICGYHSVSDWIYTCYRRLEAQAEILRKKQESSKDDDSSVAINVSKHLCIQNNTFNQISQEESGK